MNWIEKGKEKEQICVRDNFVWIDL